MRISTYPKYFDHSINLEIFAENESHCIISLSNFKGKIRIMMGVNISQGPNHIVIEQVGSLEVGEYNLQVRTSDAKILYNTDLIKQ